MREKLSNSADAKKKAEVKQEESDYTTEKEKYYLDKAKDNWLEIAETDDSLGHWESASEKYYKAGEFEKAKEMLLKAAQYDERKKYYSQAAYLYKKLGETEKEKEMLLKEAEKLKLELKSNVWAKHNDVIIVAEAFEAVGEKEMAKEVYSENIKRFEAEKEYIQVALLCEKIGDFDKAKEMYLEEIKKREYVNGYEDTQVVAYAYERLAKLEKK